MNNPFILFLLILFCMHGCSRPPTFTNNIENSGECFNRDKESYYFKVDSHLHFQPFGGPSLKHKTLMSYLKKLGIEYATMYGIGQALPFDSSCAFLADCRTKVVKPAIRNDFANAYFASQSLLINTTSPGLTVSMSSLDLNSPQSTASTIQLLDNEYPGLFRFAGEANLIKQSLFKQGQPGIDIEKITEWKAFMPWLAERSIPIAIHSDLGNDSDTTKYLNLIKTVLKIYPNNTIIWMHMGLSPELTTLSAREHIIILSELLDQYPNLLLDLSWNIIYQQYFRFSDKRALYVEFLNKYYNRFLTGSDFVASRYQSFSSYESAVKQSSFINQFIDNRAFRHIALGKNYYDLLNIKKTVAKICTPTTANQ